MGYINPLWIEADRHGKHLYDAGVYAEVEVNVDAKLYRDCFDRGIDIPVDGNGYIDSTYLQSIATHLAFWYLFQSASKLQDNDVDAYGMKSMESQQQYRDAISGLCYSKV